MTERGMVHIYCGDGKGKTTAAIGLAARASGSGKPVVVLRFLKGARSGELDSLRLLPGVSIVDGPESVKFLFRMTEEEKTDYKRLCCELFGEACGKCERGGLLVLDEALDAVDTGMLPEARLLDFLKNRPEGLEVVLTGRDPSEALFEQADYVTRMVKVKHPYDSGVQARRGIEF